jgi:hypothetical protein
VPTLSKPADALKVLVFGHANPDYFIAHYDM